jgi:mxaJ protein
MRHLVKTLALSALAIVLAGADGRADPADRALAKSWNAPSLRVCADPAGLPYSNEKREGFENRIAAIVAKELGAKLEYAWWVQRRGFLRNTLQAGKCDVVIGVPVGLEMVRTTRPYYRSTFAFVTRKASGLGTLNSFDDPRLRALEIGVPLAGDDGANPAPVHALARRGVIDKLHGFPLYGELGREIPAAAEAVEKGVVDVAILWGPVAGYAAQRSHASLTVVPVSEEADDSIPLAFTIAMGVRKDDPELALRLDSVLERKRDEISGVLRRAGVPMLPLPLPSAEQEKTDALP